MKIFFIFFFLPLLGVAQEYETTVRDIGFKSSQRTVIDEETIKKSKATDVTGLLQSHGNISVSSAGFQKNTLFLRGGDSSNILILIDGAAIYDAGTAQRTLNLNTLNLKNIRKIEIVRGAQTVLYGGQALSGIIKIETFNKEIKDVKTAQVDVGTQSYKNGHLFMQKPIGENQGVQGNIALFSKENPSPILDSTQVYPQNNLNADLAYTFKGDTDVVARVFKNQDKSYLSTLSAGYKTLDATDLTQEAQFSGLTLSARNNDLKFRPELFINVSDSNRKFSQPGNSTNVLGGVDFEDVYASQLHNVRGTINALETENLLFKIGGSYFKESFVFRQLGTEIANSYDEQKGAFAKLDFNLDENYEFEMGGRTDSSTKYSSEFTSQLGLTFYKRTKLEYATAFRTPSQYQFYGSYGNLGLAPEKAVSYTLSHDLPLTTGHRLSVAVFQIDFSNLISTKTIGFLPKYFNVSRAQVIGSELLYSFSLDSDLSGFLRYTYQDPRDQDTGWRLQRRPMNSAGAGLNKKWNSQNAGVDFVYSGDREAQLRSTRYKILSEYIIANAVWNVDINDHTEGYVRINNITDTRYEESYDYFHEGRFASAGLGWSY